MYKKTVQIVTAINTWKILLQDPEKKTRETRKIAEDFEPSTFDSVDIVEISKLHNSNSWGPEKMFELYGTPS